LLKKSPIILSVLAVFCFLLEAYAAPVYLYQTSENWLSLSSVKTFFDLLLAENKIVKDLSALEGEAGSVLVVPLTSKLESSAVSHIAKYTETGTVILYPAADRAIELNSDLISKLQKLDPGTRSKGPVTYVEYPGVIVFSENVSASINTDATREVLVDILRIVNPGALTKADASVRERVAEIEKLITNALNENLGRKNPAAQAVERDLTNLLQEAKTLQSKNSGNIWAVNALKTEVEAQLELYKATAYPSIPVETRGIWISSKAIPKTRAGIEELVKRIADAGFNVILPEVFSHGYTIYPSKTAEKYGIQKQNSAFLNFDPLEVLVEESKKQGVEIHTWFSVFYVGLNTLDPILSKYPSWAAVNKDGTLGYNREGNHLYFASPLSLEFREYVTDLMVEVAEYGVDGIHLDYIRYSGMDVPETDFSEAAVSNFVERYGLLPDERRTQGPVLWIYYRSNGVDQLVEMVAEKVRAINPKIYVSAAVAPDGPPTNTQRNYLQNWPLWLKNGYVDFVIPMTYSPNPANVAGWFATAVKKAPASSQVFAGVSAFNLYNRLSLNNQVTQLGRTSGSLGSFFFAYDHFDLQGLKVLRAGVFSQDAVPAHRLQAEDWQLLLGWALEQIAGAKSRLADAAYEVLVQEFEGLSAKAPSITTLQDYLYSVSQIRYLLSLLDQPAYSNSQLKGPFQMLESWLLAFGRKGIDQEDVYLEMELCIQTLAKLAPNTIYHLIPLYLYENQVFDVSFSLEVERLLKTQLQDQNFRLNRNLTAVLEKLYSTALLLQGGAK